MASKTVGAAQARYQKLASTGREQFLQRARHNALLTIPSLMPLQGHDGKAHLIEPYQGLGATGVTHLSSRLVMAFLPAGRPYMRFALSPAVLMENNGEVPKDTERGLALSEQLVQGEVEDKEWRPSTLMTVQQLLVAGNAVEFQMPDNRIRVFRLDQYVCRRDHAGRVIELIIEEKLQRDTLPEGLEAPAGVQEDEDINLYTIVKLERKGGGRVYRRTQELDGAPIGAPTEFSIEAMPYHVLRWSATPGEDYGRSKVEEHIADLRSLDSLEKAQLEMAGMASRNFIMIRPSATGAGLKRRITQVINGDVVMGDPDSVELKSFDNAAGFQITAQQVQVLRESLAKAFLLFSAGQRDAERVTAAEIERDIQELEAALGGNFSSLNTQMMERRTVVLMGNMERDKKLPPLSGIVSPMILTGLEALSRERDVSRVVQVGNIAQAFGPEAVDTLKLDKLLSRATIGLGFPDAVRTDDEVQQRQQQRAEREAAQAAIPQVAGQVAKQGGGT
jgi:hypothetical protein